MVLDSKIIARQRARWQGRSNVERFAESIGEEHSSQRLKNGVEAEIVRRFVRGDRRLDVGIGTGRVSLPLLADGVQLTGVDASAAMIERCGDPRAAAERSVSKPSTEGLCASSMSKMSVRFSTTTASKKVFKCIFEDCARSRLQTKTEDAVDRKTRPIRTIFRFD